jgi:cytochrome c biogenesis protein CcmG, thiol:disulfide interchange protein DsbE
MKSARGFAAAAVILVSAALLWTLRGGFAPLDAGALAPEYAAVTLDGDSVRLSDLRGQVVLLNVWATWCTPCVREMPALQRLHEMLEPRGLAVVAVSVDAEGSAFGGDNDVRSFVEEFGLTFTVLRDASGRIESAFGVPGLPMTFVIDRDGRIQRKVLGAREWDDPELASDIESLLDG